MSDIWIDSYNKNKKVSDIVFRAMFAVMKICRIKAFVNTKDMDIIIKGLML